MEKNLMKEMATIETTNKEDLTMGVFEMADGIEVRRAMSKDELKENELLEAIASIDESNVREVEAILADIAEKTALRIMDEMDYVKEFLEEGEHPLLKNFTYPSYYEDLKDALERRIMLEDYLEDLEWKLIVENECKSEIKKVNALKEKALKELEEIKED